MRTLLLCDEQRFFALSITKQIVASDGTAMSNASLAGYSFTLTGQNGEDTVMGVTNQAGQVKFAKVRFGSFTLSETPSPGTSLGTMTIDGADVQAGQPFQTQAGKTYTVTAVNTQTAP